MFAKLAIISTLAVLAVATPVPDDGAGQCNVGSLQCCDSVQSSDNKSVQNLLGLLGVALDGLTVPVGLTCTPISVSISQILFILVLHPVSSKR